MMKRTQRQLQKDEPIQKSFDAEKKGERIFIQYRFQFIRIFFSVYNEMDFLTPTNIEHGNKETWYALS